MEKASSDSPERKRDVCSQENYPYLESRLLLQVHRVAQGNCVIIFLFRQLRRASDAGGSFQTCTAGPWAWHLLLEIFSEGRGYCHLTSPTYQCRERQAVYIELFAKLSSIQGMVVGLELPKKTTKFCAWQEQNPGGSWD